MPSLSSPFSPRSRSAHRRQDSIESQSSGDDVVSPSTNDRIFGEITCHDTYLCAHGVNADLLLHLSRKTVDRRVRQWGGNALAGEAWYILIRPENLRQRTYKVTVSYTGSIICCDNPGPQTPVNIHKAIGVPGLMTILEHNHDVRVI